MPKLKLTKASVEALPFTESGQVMYVDTELKGFAIVVGRVAKAYIAQKDVRGRTRRITIGRHGTWTTELARKEAQHLLVEMDRGFDPVEKKKTEASDLITFGEAYRIHLERIQRLGRSPRTIETYHERVDRCLSIFHPNSFVKKSITCPLYPLPRILPQPEGDYRVASHDVHANPKGIFYRIGSLADRGDVLSGATNDAIGEPGQYASIALLQLMSNLISLNPTFENVVIGKTMQHLVDDIKLAFNKAQEKLIQDEVELRKKEAQKRGAGGED